jgi:hypothetical protein
MTTPGFPFSQATGKRHTAGWRQRQRVAEWKENASLRREAKAEQLEAGQRIKSLMDAGQGEEALFVRESDNFDANVRALQLRGIDTATGLEYGLLYSVGNISGGNKGYQAVLRKIDYYLSRGFTVKQALSILEDRLHKVQDRDGLNQDNNLLNLVREQYNRFQRTTSYSRRRKL